LMHTGSRQVAAPLPPPDHPPPAEKAGAIDIFMEAEAMLKQPTAGVLQDPWALDGDASTTASSTQQRFQRGLTSSGHASQSQQSASSHTQDMSLLDVDEHEHPDTSTLLEKLMRDLSAQRRKLDGLDEGITPVATGNATLFGSDITRKAQATELRRPQLLHHNNLTNAASASSSSTTALPFSQQASPQASPSRSGGPGGARFLGPSGPTGAQQDGPWWELQMQLGSMMECVEDLDNSGALYFPRDQPPLNQPQPHLPAVLEDPDKCTRAAWGDPRLINAEALGTHGGSSGTPRAAWGDKASSSALQAAQARQAQEEVDSDDEFREARSGKSWLCGFGSLRRSRKRASALDGGVAVLPSQPSSGSPLSSSRAASSSLLQSPLLSRKKTGSDIIHVGGSSASRNVTPGPGLDGIQQLMQQFMQQQQEQSVDFRKQLDAVQTAGFEMRNELREQVKLCRDIQGRQEELRGTVGRLDDEVKLQSSSVVRAPSRSVLSSGTPALSASAMGSAMGPLDASTLLASASTTPLLGAAPLAPPPVPPPGTVGAA